MPELHGKISFMPRTLLRLDGKIIETEMIKPDELRDFVEESTPIISRRVDTIYQKGLEKSHRPELQQLSIIYIARIALHEWDKTVFQTVHMPELKRVTASPHVLLPMAQEYWNAIETPVFQPEIHIRSVDATKGTSGVWLSLRTRSNPLDS
jgi:hypothetical protein